MIPENAEWNLAGAGASQTKTILWALGGGGHVRIGLEDNQYLSKGVKGSNAQFVEHVARIANEIGREIASGDEARAILGITV